MCINKEMREREPHQKIEHEARQSWRNAMLIIQRLGSVELSIERVKVSRNSLISFEFRFYEIEIIGTVLIVEETENIGGYMEREN